MLSTEPTAAAISHDEMCPHCSRPVSDGADTYRPHHLTEEEARQFGAKAGIYHDECCPECNGVLGSKAAVDS